MPHILCEGMVLPVLLCQRGASRKTSFTPRALASSFLSPRLFCVHHAYPSPSTPF